jgi:lysophospholipase L1-like esterase
MMLRPYPRAPLSSLNILAHGNSLTAGVGAGASANAARWTDVAAARLGIVVANYGVGGQSIQGMKSTAPTVIDANLQAGKLNVLVAWEFTNEVSTNGRDPVAAHNQWVSYCNARRAAALAAGKKLYIITVGLIPAGAGATSAITDARMAAMIAANNLLRANYRAYSDQFVDLASMEPFKSLYAGGDWSTSAFDSASVYHRSDGTADDRVHLGDAGYAMVGRAIAQAIKRVRRL